MNVPSQLSELLKDPITVLVLGHGLNLQASRRAGFPASDDWFQILNSLWIDHGDAPVADEQRHLTHIIWDRLVHNRQQISDKEAADPVQELAHALSQKLGEVEQEQQDTDLYEAVAESAFINIISFNIDRRVIRQNDAFQESSAELNLGDKWDRDEIEFARLKSKYEKYPFVFRRWNAGRKNVWFPYGDSSDSASIELGIASFDKRLMGVEDYRKDFIEQWYLNPEIGWPGQFNFSNLYPPDVVYSDLLEKKRSRGIVSWLDLLFLAPIVFLGVSLSQDDWPLWLTLHQRERNFVHFPADRRPKSYFLTTKDRVPHHLRGKPAGIDVVEFESFDAMWDFVVREMR